MDTLDTLIKQSFKQWAARQAPPLGARKRLLETAARTTGKQEKYLKDAARPRKTAALDERYPSLYGSYTGRYHLQDRSMGLNEWSLASTLAGCTLGLMMVR